ncbi:hypothetical protein OO013_19295 [Mangrovivirga sp. M17]|uniref:Outer membrane protein with beta-barrel domain n=1 Tax=Mangrovivirga halotolerans TaxID=2993936 RepID=A0ABT3RXE0_9BACT|nr:hypothetical protein [Mangrovivirga halotolerans]MCX2746034.1 hypothetical protein [Mangrovivirga halotolerans]
MNNIFYMALFNLFKIKYSVFFMLFIVSNWANAQDCQNLTPQQLNQIQNYAEAIVPIVLFKLHPAPNNDTERQEKLDSLKTYDYPAYVELINNIQGFIANTSQEQQVCFYKIADNTTVNAWISYIYRKDAPTNESLSPEFQKGIGILAEINQGVIDPFRSTEQYLLTVKGLLAYTFAKEQAGGRIRMMLGPSLYYSKQEVDVYLTSRMEVRIYDLKAEPVSLGTFKFLLEGSTDLDGLWIAGPGVGLEFPQFGVKLLHQWRTGTAINQLELGISYRFLN